jgi:hypothetical protein
MGFTDKFSFSLFDSLCSILDIGLQIIFVILSTILFASSLFLNLYLGGTGAAGTARILARGQQTIS